MIGVARLLVFAALAGALAGCATEGAIGPEAYGLAAKGSVTETPATARRATAANPESRKPGSGAETAAPKQATAGRTDREAKSGALPAADRSRVAAADAKAAADATLIPAHSLFGNWTLGEEDGRRTCRVILGGALMGTGYSARSDADCPPAFSSLHSWEIQGDQLVLRNHARGVVGRLQPTGPYRFDGQSESGASIYLVR